MAGIYDNGRIKIDSFNHKFKGQFLKGDRQEFTGRAFVDMGCMGYIELPDNSRRFFDYYKEEYKFVFKDCPTKLEWQKGKNF